MNCCCSEESLASIMYLNIVFDILKTILNAGTGIPGSLSNGDLSPFYLLLWNDFYTVFCLCWYSKVELGHCIYSHVIGQWVAQRLFNVCLLYSVHVLTQRGQLGARGKIGVNLKDDFVLFAGLFLYLKGNFLMDTGALILTSNLF